MKFSIKSSSTLIRADFPLSFKTVKSARLSLSTIDDLSIEKKRGWLCRFSEALCNVGNMQRSNPSRRHQATKVRPVHFSHCLIMDSSVCSNSAERNMSSQKSVSTTTRKVSAIALFLLKGLCVWVNWSQGAKFGLVLCNWYAVFSNKDNYSISNLTFKPHGWVK